MEHPSPPHDRFNKLKHHADHLAVRTTPLMDRFTALVNGHHRDIFTLKNVTIARGPISFGIWLMFIVFGVFGLWAAIAPLDSAAVAKGVVVLDSNKKTIQHLEGGIIEEILVHEGKTVEAGDPLIKLSETAARARLDLLNGQLHAEQATLARLMAERDDAKELTFPPEFATSTDAQLKEIMDSQQRLFETRKKALDGEMLVLRQRISQSREEIQGLTSQERSAQEQTRLITEEANVVEKLLATGNAARPRLLALQRTSAELSGRRGEYLAMIARAQKNITQTETEILNLQNTRLKEIVDQIRTAQVNIGTLSEQRNAAQDVLKRLAILAPQSGIITGLRFHTKGGVIGPGEALMDLVPQDDKLIIEAQISPQDIDVVHQGQKARVRLSAYKTRNIPPVEGEIMNVSADRFIDKISGQAYFLARVAIPQKELEELKSIALYPGMPAEVLIVTGSRTLFAYMLSPITDSLFLAFREQ